MTNTMQRYRDCRFVCFAGIDGSGKTTLAHAVVRTLSRQQEDFHYVHGLIYPRLMKPFMAIGRFLFARGRSSASDYKEFVLAKRDGLSRCPILLFSYRTLLFLDYVPQVFVKVTLPLLFRRRIVLDRYVYDVVVNMSLNIGFDLNKAIKTIETYFWMVPKPDVAFLIDVPEEVAFSRKADVPSIEYLLERRAIYRELAEGLGMVILDGTMSVEDLTTMVVRTIRARKGQE